MAESTTLRVRPATRDRLNRLARETRVSVPELLDRLVRREEEERLLAMMNDDFRALRGREHDWQDFQVDTALWDGASAPLEPGA